jgi:hypothetical protein
MTDWIVVYSTEALTFGFILMAFALFLSGTSRLIISSISLVVVLVTMMAPASSELAQKQDKAMTECLKKKITSQPQSMPHTICQDELKRVGSQYLRCKKTGCSYEQLLQ